MISYEALLIIFLLPVIAFLMGRLWESVELDEPVKESKNPFRNMGNY